MARLTIAIKNLRPSTRVDHCRPAIVFDPQDAIRGRAPVRLGAEERAAAFFLVFCWTICWVPGSAMRASRARRSARRRSMLLRTASFSASYSRAACAPSRARSNFFAAAADDPASLEASAICKSSICRIHRLPGRHSAGELELRCTRGKPRDLANQTRGPVPPALPVLPWSKPCGSCAAD